LLHVRRQRLECPELLQEARALALTFNATRILIEDASSGSALIQALRRENRLSANAMFGVRPAQLGSGRSADFRRTSN
jgi:phage terminase large subunit-like protein